MQQQDTTAGQRVALYTRVSTSEQGLEGYSLPNQRATLEAYAAARGWAVVGAWSDTDSGRRDDRAAYLAMLADKGWDTLLVWRVDRLGRDTAELFRVAKALRKAGKRLESATENVDDPFVMGLNFLLAERESRLIGERVRPVMLRLASEGRFLGRAPLGYTMVDGRLVVDDVGAALYREAVRRVLAGESARSIVRDWNARGIGSPRGAAGWNHTTLTRILRNPTHAGLVRWHGLGEPVKGTHEALVSLEDWQAVQEQLTRAGEAWSHITTREPSSLLVGYGRCACGASLGHHWAGGLGYYACRAHRQGQACPARGMVRAVSAEAAVRWVLAPLLGGDVAALLTHYRGAEVIDCDAAAVAAERARARLTTERDRAQRQIAGLIDALAAGDIDRDEYRAARGRAVAARDQAEASLAALPPPSIQRTADPEQTARLLSALGAVYDQTTLAGKRELLTLLGVSIAREPAGLWVRVAPAWRPWTRGDTFFPISGDRTGRGSPSAVVVPSGDKGTPYAPERTLENAAD